VTLPAGDHRSSTLGAYRLATVTSPDGPCPVVVSDQGLWSVAEVLPHLVPDYGGMGLLPILDRWDVACRALAAFIGGRRERLDAPSIPPL
jgi:hypothetical protein